MMINGGACPSAPAPNHLAIRGLCLSSLASCQPWACLQKDGMCEVLVGRHGSFLGALTYGASTPFVLQLPAGP